MFEVPWSPLAALWAFLLQLSIVTLVAILLAQLVLAGVLNDAGQLALLLPANSVAAAGVTILVVARRHPGHTWRLRGPRSPAWRQVWRGIGYGIAVYVAVGFLLASALQALVTAGGGELPQIQPTFRQLAGDPSVAPIFFFSAVLLAPVGEELMYRGLLFQSLRARLGVWPGVGLSALAFGLQHLDPAVTSGANLLVLTSIFAIGMIMAWIFNATGSLVVPIVAHCTFNAIGAVLLLSGVGT